MNLTGKCPEASACGPLRSIRSPVRGRKEKVEGGPWSLGLGGERVDILESID